MKRIDIEEILRSKAPDLFDKYPKFIAHFLVIFLKKMLYIGEINDFLHKYSHHIGIDFITSLFDHLNFSFDMSDKSRDKIPSEGKLVIVSNHPLGGLDGLALLKAISEVRSDVKIVANDILSNLSNLSDLFLPFDLYSHSSQKENILRIEKALNNDEAVIFFPSGEVSRLTLAGIKDRKWKKGAIRFAIKSQAPVLPIYVCGKNSKFFYIASFIWNKIGTFLLPHELFNKKNKTIRVIIGDPIPAIKFENAIDTKTQMDLLKKHIYRVGKGKRGIFATEKTIMHPVPVKLVRAELVKSELLGKTIDGKKIFLCKKEECPNVLKEISRLREITFRKVGEGTGKSYDTDIYDTYYHHLVLWDEDNLDIVGSYRLGITNEILAEHGINGLYNASQFDFDPSFNEVLSQSIELGRSFIQQKYWRTNALDYIWQGIGAFIKKYPETRYLWGAVSISNSYSEPAKNMIVYYFRKWYQCNSAYAIPLKPFMISKNNEKELEELFSGQTVEEDFRILKTTLKTLGFSIPVLYRRYTDVCEYGGANFISYNIDEHFMNAIDGLVLVDLHQLKEEYRDRYFNQKSFEIAK